MISREMTSLPIFSILKKKKERLHFITLNYTLNYTLYPKLWISIQINSKLEVEVQNVTKIIV